MKIIKQGHITPKSNGIFRYHAWPTVITLNDGTLLAAWSGERLKHFCPFGKVMLSRSFDGGYSWTAPYCGEDTPLDDRDAGLLQVGDKILMTSVTNHRKLQREFNESGGRLHMPDSPEKKALISAYLDLITDEDEERYLGPTIAVSYDQGYTFQEMKRLPLTCPHGPALLKDGRILHVGSFSAMFPDRYKRGVYAEQIDDDGNFLCEPWLVAQAPDEVSEWCEPHICQMPNGDLLVAIRYKNEDLHDIYLCRSTDGGKTFSKAQSTGWDGFPPHIYVTSKGAVVLSYGCRHKPARGIRARVSYDNGHTFGEEIVLRDDGVNWDLGYPSTTENANGQLVTVYYMKENNDPNENRIQFTIWEL